MGLMLRLGVGAAALAAGFAGAAKAETPRHGGILNYVVAGAPPSYDGHQESTFSVIHPIAPFYSTLIKVNPANPGGADDYVCDLCVGDVPKPTEGGTKFTFPIHKNVKFHDGEPLTAHDLVATYNKILSPPEGTLSVRKAYYDGIEGVYADDDYTFVIKLKRPSLSFLPALASPYDFVYSASKLKQDGNWYKTNIVGTGPFKLKELQPGALMSGDKYPDYHVKGLPYLDGFVATFADNQSLRVQAIRGGRASIEFRGFPPKSRDDLVAALGDKIVVQEDTWNCNVSVSLNPAHPPFADQRVRRALTLAIDRWGGSKYLSEIAIMKTVGGLVFPGHPLAATKEELQKIDGYWPDIEKSRAEARRLLKEAGQENLSFDLCNRNVDQPYKIAGTWLIGEWKKVGVTVEQRALTTGEWFRAFRETKDYQACVTATCQSIVNPPLDVVNNISVDRSTQNYRGYIDREADRLYDEMLAATDPADQRVKMRRFEDHILQDMSHYMIVLWWNRIVPHRSHVKGWKVSPSHYLGQDLSVVWLGDD
jgi:peptide/nickel transport system substrate-binding protein